VTDRLFVYGTLAPGRPKEHVLEPLHGTWRAATVRGDARKRASHTAPRRAPYDTPLQR
jgi:gamma-glutamylcyclotransferase (GGCT)/AIG2-like uncharacterized protein YtfP